jgi:hypothetical protein
MAREGGKPVGGDRAMDLVVTPRRMERGLRSTKEKYKLEKSLTTTPATTLRILKGLYLQQNRCEKIKCRSTKRALL